MTTRVTINPSGHHIEVDIIDIVKDGTHTHVERMGPGDAPRDFWVHSTRSLAVREVIPT